MEIEVLKLSEVYMELKMKGVDTSLLNSLRRTVISEVPCMAIDDVVIIENSSVIYDEMLSHRLGLIPIKTDLDSYNLPEECPCKSEFGCPLCTSSLTLDVESESGIRVVYSGDLIPENPDIAPVSKDIPIVKLSMGQRIRLEAYARLGKGKKHAKWQPVSLCVYKRPQAQVDEKADGFIFAMESAGVLPVQRIFLEALKILNNKAMEFNEWLSQMRHENLGEEEE